MTVKSPPGVQLKLFFVSLGWRGFLLAVTESSTFSVGGCCRPKLIDKISQGKLNKFISDNTLLNQIWIMDPKKKVKDILKTDITVIDFVRFKVGEGVD